MKLLRFPPALAPPGLRRLGPADVVILCLLGGVIAAVVAFAREFEAPFLQAVQIDLRPAALPRYTLYSLSRGVSALLISYLFALGFGYAAAKSRPAELLLLPLLDILQSIPVLGFLPGLVLGLVSLFPTRNVGLELAAILMIFTAQACNLALSFYHSLKGIPVPLRVACKIAVWRPRRTFWELEVPAAAQGLVWNGMLSMAGGWFFLMVNEAFRLGDRDYRLPGVGSYMSVALDQGNVTAMGLAIGAMVAMIVCVDQLLWRPLVVWVEKFRLDETAGTSRASSWVLDFLRRARLPRRAAALQRRAYRTARRAARPFERPFRAAGPVILRGPRFAFEHPIARKAALGLLGAVVVAAAAAGGWQLWRLLAQLAWRDWGELLSAAALTFDRVGRPCGGAHRSLAARRAGAAAGDPGRGLVSRADAVPAGDPPVRAHRHRARARRGRADGAGGPVVHPVQRHLRRGRHPVAAQGGGDRVPAAGTRALALAVPAGRHAGARDRLGHRGGRRVERLDRRRVHRGRREAAGDEGAGQPDQRGDGARELPPARGRDRPDEPARGRLEPGGLALAHGVGAGPLRVRRGDVTAGGVLLEARQVTQRFKLPNGQVLEALRDVSLAVCEHEVVALVGPSGCGKSTLLRLFAGLARAAEGTVLYRGQRLDGVLAAAAMVFQSFALLPWLTVTENVAMGLEARGVHGPAQRDAVARAINLVGLDGFEQAYPRELSGGMKQRVGFARAVAVATEILLMDEPFGALDPLTAENLRSQVVNLWRDPATGVNTLVVVTHSVRSEE